MTSDEYNIQLLCKEHEPHPLQSGIATQSTTESSLGKNANSDGGQCHSRRRHRIGDLPVSSQCRTNRFPPKSTVLDGMA